MQTCLEAMARPWEWGAADCCTAACDVFMRLHDIDPMEPLRGRYDTRLGAMRLIAQEGGMIAMATRLAGCAGLQPGSAAAGEIGVIVTQGQLALGIGLGCAWVGKSKTGMATVPECVRSWRA